MTTDTVPAHDELVDTIARNMWSPRTDEQWANFRNLIVEEEWEGFRRIAEAVSSLLATARADGEARIAAYRKVVFDPISDYYGEIREKFDAIDRAAVPLTERNNE